MRCVCPKYNLLLYRYLDNIDLYIDIVMEIRTKRQIIMVSAFWTTKHHFHDGIALKSNT